MAMPANYERLVGLFTSRAKVRFGLFTEPCVRRSILETCGEASKSVIFLLLRLEASKRAPLMETCVHTQHHECLHQLSKAVVAPSPLNGD